MRMAGEMKRFAYPVFVVFVLLAAAGSLPAAGYPPGSGETVRGIVAEGACAIVGMSAEQSQLTALQRARAAAIEQAAGVSVTAATLVTNFAVAADFIKTYARGFIVREKAAWLPLGQYQRDASVAPIPEYRVRIEADVYVPKKPVSAVGLKARLGNTVFRSGEKVSFTLGANREAAFAVFNIRADDRVALLFPNEHASDNRLEPGRETFFPAKDAKFELEVQTLPGHARDAEAFLIVAWDAKAGIGITELFSEAEPLPFAAFFAKLALIADRVEERILPYEVVAGGQ